MTECGNDQEEPQGDFKLAERRDIVEVIQRLNGEVAVLTVAGPSSSRWDVALFANYIRELVLDGVTKVVVDFSQMKKLGIPMLDVMRAGQTALWAVGGEMRLANVSKRVERILTVTRLESVFPSWDTVETPKRISFRLTTPIRPESTFLRFPPAT